MAEDAGKVSYRRALKLTRSLGMSVEDGLGFTVCGGDLVNGEKASDWIARRYGWGMGAGGEYFKVLPFSPPTLANDPVGAHALSCLSGG